MDTEELKYKVIIIGDSSVGKTSIAVRQCRGEFYQDITPTIGSAHLQTKITYGDKRITLIIWDTAGQEEFAPLVPMYARKANCAIVCAAVNSEDSIDHINKWVETLNDSGEHPPIIVALNKFDLIEGNMNEIDKLTKIIQNKYESFFFCSAKSNHNINELFMEVASKCIEQSNKGSETVSSDLKTSQQNPKKCC